MIIFRAMRAGREWRLGLLPLLLVASALSHAGSIVPYAVNDSGLIVGEYTGGPLPIAVVFNTATDTYSYPNVSLPGVTSSAFVGINDSGQITGSYTTSSGAYGFLDNAGTFTTISAPGAVQSTQGIYLFGGGGTIVSGINNSGMIVGALTTSSTEPGFVDSGGTFSNYSYPSAVYTLFYGINDSGIISGTAVVHSGSLYLHVGFLYNTNTNTFTPILYPGATNTAVQGVNDSGEVVGFYNVTGNLGGVGTMGFTYLNGTYTSFTYPGSNSTELFGISNNGIISGTYTCASDPSCTSDPAFYATPTQNGYAFTTLPTATPEPSAFVLLGCGLVALGVAWRKDRRRRTAPLI